MQPQRTIIHVTDRLTFYEENITFKELSEYISKNFKHQQDAKPVSA